MPPNVAKAKAKRGVLKAKARPVVKAKAPQARAVVTSKASQLPAQKGAAAPKLGHRGPSPPLR